MKINELEEMLNNDLAVDHRNIVAASLQTPTLHAKWMKFATDEAYKLKILHHRMAKLKKAKWDFYLGRAGEKAYIKKPFNLKLTKGEVPIYIDADDDIQRLERQIEQQSILVDRLSEAVKSIQYRHINIKNAIEMMKLQNGIVG